MIARYLGAVLGLLAFSMASFAGLAVGNPAQTVLSRALWSLMVFCVIGLAVGMAAQVVINEYESRKTKELKEADKERTSDSAAELDQQAKTNKSTPQSAEPMGT